MRPLFLLLAAAACAAQNSTRLVVTLASDAQAAEAGVLLENATWAVAWASGPRVVMDLARPAQLPHDTALYEELFSANNLTIVSSEIDLLVSSVVIQMLPYDAGDGWQYADDQPYSLQMESVWHNDSLTGNASVVVAVLDSGLARAAMDALFYNLADGYDFIEQSLSPLDPGATMSDTCPAPYHGTMMASIIAGRPEFVPGILSMQPNVTLLPIRVLDECGQGYANDVAEAILWAVGANVTGLPPNPAPAAVLSMSFVGLGTCPPFLQSAIDVAVLTYGAILVASAGNDGADVSDYFPANCAGVLPAAASAVAGDLAYYSNFGAEIRVAAPGGAPSAPIFAATVSADGSLVPASAYGSSFSAAFVAGMFGLKLSMGLPITPEHPFFADETTPFAPDAACFQSTVCGPGIESGERLVLAARALAFALPNATNASNTSVPAMESQAPFAVKATTVPTLTYLTALNVTQW